jgi:hypothetical protein
MQNLQVGIFHGHSGIAIFIAKFNPVNQNLVYLFQKNNSKLYCTL